MRKPRSPEIAVRFRHRERHDGGLRVDVRAERLERDVAASPSLVPSMQRANAAFTTDWMSGTPGLTVRWTTSAPAPRLPLTDS